MATKPTLVIGGTGNVGGQVVSQLAAEGTPVRVLARKPAVAGLPDGVDIAQGDLTRPETLDTCLDGIESVFLLWTAPPATATAVVEKMVRRVRRIVFLSSPHKTPHPFFQRPQPNVVSLLHMEIERVITASGVEWTFIRPGMFAANTRFWWADQIRAGDVVRWPYAEATTAPIDEGDIGAVAVRSLSEDGHAGAEYLVTGPESITQAEQVVTIGRVIGRPLRMEDISPDEARRELPSVIPVPAIGMLLAAWSGAMEEPALVTSTVAEVTGRPARRYVEWVEANVWHFTRR